MKIIAQKYKDGSLTLLDAPVPALKSGGVLVRSRYSIISVGTEMTKVAESKLSLAGKARARPDQVRKVLQTLSQQGPLATFQKVMNRLESYTPLGYSLSGIVEDVARDVEGFGVGQRVACGGNQFALHAEMNWVPVNLCVPVPDQVSDEEAAFTTVGAVAMQGFRQSELKLGETAVVIGLGLLGQILVRILRAAGIRAFGLDLDEGRCRLAEEEGLITCASSGSVNFDSLLSTLDRETNGAGADCVFLTVGTNSNEPVEMAARLSRDRGRVVDVGKCSLDLPRDAFYEKELDLRFSRSYGPGRYDPLYEEQGIDYPIGYVRWTEKRNMAAFLDLVARKRIDLGPLISSVHDFSDAVSVYEKMNAGKLKGIGVLFRYPSTRDATSVIEMRAAATKKPGLARVRLGVIGCGNYASSMLLPHLKDRKDVELVEVATTTALSGVNAGSKFGFSRVSTEAVRILENPDIDAVMILTPHSSHAGLVCQALRAGKAVFVEKPLAIDAEQLRDVRLAVEESGNDRLMVGFNRRHAGLLVELKSRFGFGAGDQFIQYRVNAGPLDPSSWSADRASHGGRFVGEGGHFIDTASWWMDSLPRTVSAAHTAGDMDNIAVTITFANGGVAVVTYITSGDSRYPKELMEVFAHGSVARLDNFSSAEIWRGGKRSRVRTVGGGKGQKEEMAAFVEAVRTGGAMPISLDSIFATTNATLAAERSAVLGRPVDLASDWSSAIPGEI